MEASTNKNPSSGSKRTALHIESQSPDSFPEDEQQQLPDQKSPDLMEFNQDDAEYLNSDPKMLKEDAQQDFEIGENQNLEPEPETQEKDQKLDVFVEPEIAEGEQKVEIQNRELKMKKSEGIPQLDEISKALDKLNSHLESQFGNSFKEAKESNGVKLTVKNTYEYYTSPTKFESSFSKREKEAASSISKDIFGGSKVESLAMMDSLEKRKGVLPTPPPKFDYKTELSSVKPKFTVPQKEYGSGLKSEGISKYTYQAQANTSKPNDPLLSKDLTWKSYSKDLPSEQRYVSKYAATSKQEGGRIMSQDISAAYPIKKETYHYEYKNKFSNYQPKIKAF